MDLRPCPACGASDAEVKFEEPPFLVVECASCSLVYLGNPPPEEALYEEYYGGSEPSVAAYRRDSDNAGLRELFALNEQRVERLRKLNPGGTLLDVGCGRGYFLKAARDSGYNVYGMDVSERAVAFARESFGIRAEARSLQDVVASGEHFDVITLWHVLEHFVDPYAALTAVRTLLREDGVCVVEVPNLRSLKFMLSSTKWEGGNHPLYHRTFFTPKTLRRALSETGFSRVRRMRWSYRVPGRSDAYEWVKKGLDQVGMDAFLDFAAWR